MNKVVFQVGFWSGMVAFVALVLFFIAQTLQLLGVLHFPMDQILIFGFSLCVPVPFLIAMLALHYTSPDDKKFWTHGALIFTTLYTAFVIANYVVQLATVIPMTMQGKANEVRLLEQTPHSLFWDFDAIGYIFMGVALLFAVPALQRQGFQKWVRFSFLLHAAVTPIIGFVYFYPTFSNGLLLLAIPWAITAPGTMLMLSLGFRKNCNATFIHRESQLTKLSAPNILNPL